MSPQKVSEPSPQTVTRMLFVLVVFLVGALAGNVAPTIDQRRPELPVDYTEPILLREGENESVKLVPYSVIVDGRKRQLREKTSERYWCIIHDSGRVCVNYVPEDAQK